jgi:L-lactate dehydrogenase complex protein LldG
VSSSRDAILGRIRSAIADAPVAPAVSRAYRREGELEQSARLDLLCERVADYRAEVRRISAPELAAAISDAFERRSAKRVGIPRGIPLEWRPNDLDLVADGELSPAELDRLDGVLTGCTLAIAET